MIEVTCNDRLGKKVRVKCKYPLPEEFLTCRGKIDFMFVMHVNFIDLYMRTYLLPAYCVQNDIAVTCVYKPVLLYL